MISVLLPYKNAAPTIEEALSSVLADAGRAGVPVEVLAIDNGSSDGGPSRVAGIAARDARVVCLAAGGVSLSAALGLGLAAARGDLVARMDADDISLPGRLAAERALLGGDPSLGAVGTLVENFPEVGGGLAAYVAWQNSLLSPEDHARDLFVESPLCNPSALIRRAALDAVGGWRDVPWPEDYDLWLRLDAAGWRLAKVPALGLRWRDTPGRTTFTDPRCGLPRLVEARAHFLPPRLAAMGARPLAIWGAGKTGKRLARALERAGVRAACFVDIDPEKIAGVARGAPIVGPHALERGAFTVVVAVGARGARAIVRGRLEARGFVEGEDFVCAA